jgi:paraquat-inducible protein B
MAQNLDSIAHSLNSFVKTKEFQQLPSDLHNTLASFESLSKQLSDTLEKSGPKLEALLDESSVTLNTLDTEIPKISIAAIRTLKTLDTAMATFEKTMVEIDDLVSEDSATTFALNKALREIYLTARELQLLAKTLEEHPEAIFRGKSEDSE